MTSYLDTSFVWKLYVNEIHSRPTTAWFQNYRGEIALSDLSDVEMISAFYRTRPQQQAASLHTLYNEDNAQGTYRRLTIGTSVFRLANRMAEQYGKPFGLRSLDALHLATALHHNVDAMGTFDNKLARAAKAAGLAVIDVKVPRV